MSLRTEGRSGKRILFFSHVDARGGMSVWLRRVCHGLPKYGWRCKLLLATPGNSYASDFQDWPSELEILPATYSWQALRHRIAKAIMAFEPDLITESAYWETPYAAMRELYRNRQLRARFVVNTVVDFPEEYARIRNILDITSGVTAISRSLARAIVEHFPQLKGQVFHYWTPTRMSVSPPERDSSGPLRLVYVGRLQQHQKRVFELPVLAAALVQAGVDFRLTIIGDGHDRAELERRFAAAELPPGTIHFTGWLPNEEARRLASQQHVFLMVSDFEGQSLALLEAMAEALAPVITDIPGHRELINDRQNGFLISIGNTDGFLSVLRRLAADRTLVREVGRSAWRTIKDSVETGKAIRDYVEFLDRALAFDLPDPNNVIKPGVPGLLMQRLGIPQPLQAAKRWFLRQPVY